MAHQTQDPRRTEGRFRRAGRPVALTALASVLGLASLLPSPASAATIESAPVISTKTVASGFGNQTDPHVSGNVVSYTNVGSVQAEIRYQNLATGADAAVPNGGHRDELSDISGTAIVFRRVFLDGNSTRPIMFFDTATAEAPVELDPQPGVNRSSPAIGGRTVAWVQFLAGSGGSAGIPGVGASNVVVYDLDTREARPLSFDEDKSNSSPSVSPDGSVVTWSKCTTSGPGCDVYVATKSGADWITTALTSGPDEEILPDSNGEVVVYATRVPDPGSFDIAWTAVGSNEQRVLHLPQSRETRPTISGSLVSIERDEADSPRTELWVYDLATDKLYPITDTPVDVALNDISVGPDGTVWVVWNQADGPDTSSNDIHAASFRLDANRPPDCSGVSPSASRLWPPDHKLHLVSLGGATDPDGDPVTLAVTAVSQDEPVDGADDGNTAPDAQPGSSSDQVLVRAERSESGDGRLYRVAFTATDSKQASCSGVVNVGVPVTRDGAVIDSGRSYDSLAP